MERETSYAELETMIKTLYESFLLGKIPEKRFEMLSASYEAEQAELDELIAQDQASLDVFVSDSTRIEQFLKASIEKPLDTIPCRTKRLVCFRFITPCSSKSVYTLYVTRKPKVTIKANDPTKKA